ncbi:hypothetical protein Tcan_06266 [Toxocara canis]|uniref:Uncharacterized protein n=1 Tax=Toxocara canis TaxID=6265 RepID=A0A0B2UL67_TOXCA|nr:hypothetical protein Tcan_06266 [Toxocara canis]
MSRLDLPMEWSLWGDPMGMCAEEGCMPLRDALTIVGCKQFSFKESENSGSIRATVSVLLWSRADASCVPHSVSGCLLQYYFKNTEKPKRGRAMKQQQVETWAAQWARDGGMTGQDVNRTTTIVVWFVRICVSSVEWRNRAFGSQFKM